jgi:hypothetical protein
MIGRRRSLLALASRSDVAECSARMGLLSRLAVPQDAGWHNIDILYGRPICDSQGRVVKRQLPASVVSTGGHSSPLCAESVCDSKMKRIRSWAKIISQREKWFQDVVLIGRPKLFLRMSVAEHLLAVAPALAASGFQLLVKEHV